MVRMLQGGSFRIIAPTASNGQRALSRLTHSTPGARASEVLREVLRLQYRAGGPILYLRYDMTAFPPGAGDGQ